MYSQGPGFDEGSLNNSQGDWQSTAPMFPLPTHSSEPQVFILSNPIKHCWGPEKDKVFQGVWVGEKVISEHAGRWRLKRDEIYIYIYIYIQLIHIVVQKKLTQHCKAIILPLKIKYKEHAGKEIICVTQKGNVRKVIRGWEEMQISGQKADELWKRTGCMRVQITSLRHLCFASRSSNPHLRQRGWKGRLGMATCFGMCFGKQHRQYY